MKVTDLMIGDWCRVNGIAVKVGAVHHDNIGIFDNDNSLYWCSDDGLDRIDPIPITGDILVKNGFKKQEDVNEWSYYKSQDGKGQYMIIWCMDSNYLEIGSYTSNFGEFNHFGIRYVHELQHALRLCGIEKELTI